MESYRFKKNYIYYLAIFLTVFTGWMLFSILDSDQAERNIIDKESLRLQVNYSPLER
ncbi:hypothetical protein [Ammoniphilus sp. CFH 90114]|uniref:hypothetical protein n=1 Tax=Ammoniphilus sp. CFH 90114 TaxID=2493665 RepID=UPI0013E94CED|nr:hypothetical protein [Ammoniphilus sp. CFH 90114]